MSIYKTLPNSHTDPKTHFEILDNHILELALFALEMLAQRLPLLLGPDRSAHTIPRIQQCLGSSPSGVVSALLQMGGWRTEGSAADGVETHEPIRPETPVSRTSELGVVTGMFLWMC
jgi:hypothetical protein